MTAQSDGGFFRTPAVDFGEHRRAVAVAYSSKAIDQLRGSNLALAEISKKALTAYLREAGAIYLDQKTRITKERQALPDTNVKRRHKTQLQKLAKAASLLKLQLLQLEKPAADLLWLPISDPITELMSANAGQFGDQLALHKDGQSPIALLNRDNLQKALTTIQILATDAAGALAPEKGGRPEHPGLAQWVENMRVLWTGKMGQEFTVADGEDGVSPSVAFFSAALHALDPAIALGSLTSVMRRVREAALDALTPQDTRGVTPRRSC
jgi:hypothetical protein